jgi:hypothetical protein
MIEQRTAVVTIYGGDYLDRIRDLELKAQATEEAHDRAKKAEGESAESRLAVDVPDSTRLAEEHDRIVDERDALVAEADAQALHVKLRALGRREWRDLVAAHPPRTVEKDKVSKDVAASDAQSGVNDDTFKDALIAASLIGPEGVTFEDLDQLADIDYQRLYVTAFALNRGAAPDPKASPVWRLTQTSSETSKPPSD